MLCSWTVEIETQILGRKVNLEDGLLSHKALMPFIAVTYIKNSTSINFNPIWPETINHHIILDTN